MMKRNVKHWLIQNAHDELDSCISTVPNGDNGSHKTYNVPGHLVDAFKAWAVKEMKKLKMI